MRYHRGKNASLKLSQFSLGNQGIKRGKYKEAKKKKLERQSLQLSTKKTLKLEIIGYVSSW